jgi:hypothetical protein
MASKWGPCDSSRSSHASPFSLCQDPASRCPGAAHFNVASSRRSTLVLRLASACGPQDSWPRRCSITARQHQPRPFTCAKDALGMPVPPHHVAPGGGCQRPSTPPSLSLVLSRGVEGHVLASSVSRRRSSRHQHQPWPFTASHLERTAHSVRASGNTSFLFSP